MDTLQKELVHNLKYKLIDAESGVIEAFLSVDIQRNEQNQPVATVTSVVGAQFTDEQSDRLQGHLRNIADVLKEVYQL